MAGSRGVADGAECQRSGAAGWNIAEDDAHRHMSRSIGWSEATDDARGFNDEKA